ncbi:MAG: rhamnogalacturonan acetylesterase [Lachnoclostridium sp.]|nr:rhamnogalacturonan acetylesterase [Lachnoclostridium sp.]
MNKSILFLMSAMALGIAAYGAVPAPMADVNGVVDNTPDSISVALTARPVSGSTRTGDNPVLFLVGNSTMRTGTLGNGNNGQWGWGFFMHEYFDPKKITVENHALGGMSTRTFYNVLWPDVLKGVRPGDYVIIELGHNDNGPYDSGRARATIPGIGHDSLNVVIKETGHPETVYSYGEYLRRYVDQVKGRGATPILMSLTPRLAYDDKKFRHITRVDTTYGLWARTIALEKGVPFIDLNDITASKYEKFGKDKTATMFYLDKIHTSTLGARVNAESAVEGIIAADNLELKNYLLPAVEDTITGASRKGDAPVVFVIGDSTVKNQETDEDGQWGWGSVLDEKFDTTRITIENHAIAGRSARTFLNEGRWDKIYRALRPGDYVLMQFGHNDGGDIERGKARGELPGAGSESKVYKMESNGRYEVVYTYGWYLRKFIDDALEKGAIPVVVTPSPRNRWSGSKVESLDNTFSSWARSAAASRGVALVDLNQRTGEKLNYLGKEATAPYFRGDHTHTSLEGARLNADGVAEGIVASGSTLADYLIPAKSNFIMAETGDYDPITGYGFDFDTRPVKGQTKPFYFSARVPEDGNYMVTVRLGDKKHPSSTTVRAESRRLMLQDVTTRKGEFVEKSFVVAKRTPEITPDMNVKINPREQGTLSWDDKLTLEFTGDAPAVESITIRPVAESDSVTTIFLCGNSTVVDQTYEPWASWGQIIPRYFDDKIAISNHAESGERASSFLDKKRFEKVMKMARPGDYVVIEFGHNDQKERTPGSGAWYNFSYDLKIFIDRARKAGLNPIFVTPACRRQFNDDGTVKDTHGDYLDAMRAVAEREGVPLIELNGMTKELYKALGTEGSKRAFVHYPAGTFTGQTTALEDNTHFNPYGATQIAKCILEGLPEAAPELAPHIKDFPGYDPANPDDPDKFVWPRAVFVQLDRPYGS